MLLFMLDAEFSKRSLPVREAAPGIKHGGVDMAAIGENLVQRGAGQHSPQRARVAGAFGFVIAVEQIGISGIERPVTRNAVKNEGFEKPADRKSTRLNSSH